MFATLLLAALAAPQDVQFSAKFEPASAPAGSEVELRIQLVIDEGWHVYHPNDTSAMPTSVSLAGTGFEAAGKLRSATAPKVHTEKIGAQMITSLWLEGSPELVLPVKVSGSPGVHTATATVRFMVCDPLQCLPPDSHELEVDFTVLAAGDEEAAQEAESGGDSLADLAREFGLGGPLDPDDLIQWSARLEPSQAKSGDKLSFVLTAEIAEDWHLFHPEDVSGFGTPVEVVEIGGAAFSEAGTKVVASGEPYVHEETIAGEEIRALWIEHQGEFRYEVIVNGEPGAATATAHVLWAACDAGECLSDITTPLTVDFEILPGGTVASAAELNARSGGAEMVGEGGVGMAGEGGAESTGGTTATTDPAQRSAVEAALDEGLIALILLAVGAAAISLLTPCVYPMIPITVSFFTKRAEQGKGTPLANASAYGLGIVGTFVVIGLGVTALFGATGLNSLASNPWLNFALAGLFVLFAASLMGFFEIQPPRFLQAKLSSATAQGQQKTGYAPVLLMAATFSIITFTCTVAFVGTLLAVAAKGAWFHAAIGMAVYGTTFAAPFFLLALFPAAMKKIPSAGGWMQKVKVTLGFLELILAWKFLSNADMSWELELFTRPVIIVMTAIPLFLVAIYLFGLLPMPHHFVKGKPGKFSLLFGALHAGFGIYVLLGLFNEKPYAGDLEAYFPPPHYGEELSDELLAGASENTSLVAGPAGLAWYENYHEAREVATREGKLLFVDFTGVSCLNCRRIEGNVMPHELVKPLLEQYVRAELWVDKTEWADFNKQFELEKFNQITQPLYVIMDPATENVIARHDEGGKNYNPDPSQFAAFLRKGVEWLEASTHEAASDSGRSAGQPASTGR